MADETPGGTTPPPTLPADPPKTVDYNNFRSVVDAKQGLERANAELKRQNQELVERAAGVDTLAAKLREVEARAQEAEGRFEAYTAFSGALGTTDPDVIALFDQRYRGLPEAERPSRASFVQTLRAEPDKAPAVLRPWLGSGEPPAPSPSSAPRPPQPRAPGLPPTPPAAPSKYTPEELRQIRDQALRTGDRTKWDEVTKAMGLRR